VLCQLAEAQKDEIKKLKSQGYEVRGLLFQNTVLILPLFFLYAPYSAPLHKSKAKLRNQCTMSAPVPFHTAFHSGHNGSQMWRRPGIMRCDSARSMVSAYR
jgi:hypothetical protein